MPQVFTLGQPALSKPDGWQPSHRPSGLATLHFHQDCFSPWPPTTEANEALNKAGGLHLCVRWNTKLLTITLEPRYVELGYLELPAISNRIGFALELPLEVQSRHLVIRCTESWEMYWRVHGNESNIRLTGLAAANAVGTKLLVLMLILGIKLLLQKFDIDLELFLNTLEISR